MAAASKEIRMVSSKPCRECGADFYKNPRDSFYQWEEREYCSTSCNSKHKNTPLHIRFWKYAETTDNNACWIWTGTKDDNGYGFLGHQTLHKKAHRLAYEMRFGPIADGLVVCHICDNPSCVNPNHLFAATQGDNARDMARKGRVNPVSYLNLRPGERGKLGAGSKSNKEIQNVGN